MTALPAGALDALLNGGKEAFDQVVADDRAATQKAMNTPPPTVATNDYNAAKKDAKPAAKSEPAKDDRGVAAPPKHEGAEMDLADTDTATLVQLAGLDPGPIPSQFEFDDVHLGDYAEYVVTQGIPSRIANDALRWYADRVVETMGEADVDALAARFADDFKGKLSDEQIALLVRWFHVDVLGDDGGE